MSSGVRSLRTAVLQRLIAEVPLVSGRVFTPPVAQNTPAPYLVISSYSESYRGHYRGQDSDSGFDIRGVVRLTQGDAPLLAIWDQVETALQNRAVTVAGHEPTITEVRYVTDYPEPSDSTLRNFVARCEAITVGAA